MYVIFIDEVLINIHLKHDFQRETKYSKDFKLSITKIQSLRCSSKKNNRIC